MGPIPIAPFRTPRVTKYTYGALLLWDPITLGPTDKAILILDHII